MNQLNQIKTDISNAFSIKIGTKDDVNENNITYYCDVGNANGEGETTNVVKLDVIDEMILKYFGEQKINKPWGVRYYSNEMLLDTNNSLYAEYHFRGGGLWGPTGNTLKSAEKNGDTLKIYSEHNEEKITLTLKWN